MKKIQHLGDKTAISLSLLCLVHCLLVPVFLIAVPSLGAFWFLEHDTFHLLLLYFVVPIGLVALMMGYRHHRRGYVLAIGVLGLIVLGSISILGHEIIGEKLETLLTILASCLIIIAHIKNLKLRRITEKFTQSQHALER